MEKTISNSDLLMHRYWIEKIDYKFNPSFNSINKKEIDLSPKFSRNIKKIDESRAVVSIGFQVGGAEVPFVFDLIISGLFELQNWEDEEKKFLMTENTCAILFPYLRQAITTITSTANVPPLVIPVINTFNLFNHNKK